MGLVIKQSIWNTLTSYTGIALGALNLVVLYPLFLDSEEFGLLRLLVSMTVIIAMFTRFGVDGSIIKFFPYFKDRTPGYGGLLRVGLLIGSLTSLLMLVGLYLLRSRIVMWFGEGSTLFEESYWVLYVLVVFEVYFGILQSYSRSLGRSTAPVFLREVLLRLLQMAAVVSYALLALSFESLLVIYVGNYVIMTLLLVIDLWRNSNMVLSGKGALADRQLNRQMLSFSVISVASGLAGVAMGNIDQVMVGALISEDLSFVAYYAVAFYIGSIIAIPSRAFAQIAMPVIADAWAKNDRGLLADIYKRSALVQLVVGTLLLLLLSASLDEIMSLMPDGYQVGTRIALIVGAAQLASIMFGINYGILSTSDRFKVEALMAVALIVINVVLDYFLITRLGVEGAAWATFTSLLIINVMRSFVLKRYYDLWPFSTKSIFGVLLGVIWFFFIPDIDISDIALVNIAVQSALVLGTFVPIVYVLKVSSDFNDILNKGLAYLRIRER